jgi:hypothetical protein
MRYLSTRSEEELLLPIDHNLLIVGFEEESEESQEETEEESEETEEEEGAESEEESEEQESEEEETVSKADLDRAKEALRKERQLRRQKEKELKAALRGKPATPPKKGTNKQEEEDRERADADRAAAAQSEKLAAKLATKAIDSTIVRVADKLSKDAKKPIAFQDIDDIISLVNRSEIDFDQDDDDPSEIEIDEDSVRDALRKLAKNKPHLLVKGTSSAEGDKGGKTGSKFGGKTGDKKKADDASLIKKYPALGRR